MSKPLLGIGLGAVLGMIDGLSAWLSPDARPMISTVVVGSILKGVITGLLACLIARSWRSDVVGVVSGIAIGGVLSSFAAIGQEGHYAEIILPGMLLGGVVGFATQRYPRGSQVPVAIAVGVSLLLSSSAFAQQPASTDRLAPVTSLLSTWTGTSEGQPGNGTVERDYEHALGSRFIRVRNRSTYPPQTKNPRGETHEDEGFISFDNARQHLVFRQFHTERFVITYAQDVSAKPGTLAFTSDREHPIRLPRPRDLSATWPRRVRGGIRDGRTREGVRRVLAHAAETRPIRLEVPFISREHARFSRRVECRHESGRASRRHVHRS